LARLVVEEGWKPSEAAKMFMVSTFTAPEVVWRRRAGGRT
jgi:transposase